MSPPLSLVWSVLQRKQVKQGYLVALWLWLGLPTFLGQCAHSPFCVPFGSPCFGLSRVLFLDVSPPVAGLTNGRVAIPFTWTPFTWPFAIVAVAVTPLVTPLVLVTPLPLLTMLPLIDMLSQLSLC